MPEPGACRRGTVLAFDFGTKRIGVAVGEFELAQAHPHLERVTLALCKTAGLQLSEVLALPLAVGVRWLRKMLNT